MSRSPFTSLSRVFSVCLFMLIMGSKGFSQDVMMQGWYWDYPKTANGANWTDTLNVKLLMSSIITEMVEMQRQTLLLKGG